MPAWIPAAISAVGAIGGALASKGGSEHYGPSENIWEPFRAPIQDVGLGIYDLYNQNPTGMNENMQAGIQGLAGLSQTMQPYLQYGQGMLNAGAGAMQNLSGIGQQMAGFDPTSMNAQFQGGQAVGANFGQQQAGQAFNNYLAGIQPLLQATGMMNANAYNRQAAPGITAGGIMSGAPTTKLPLNNALALGEMNQANAMAAGQLLGTGIGQSNQIGAQFGLQDANAFNQMAQQNAGQYNQLMFQQAGQNKDLRMQGLRGAGDLYGNILAQGNSYFSPMVDLQAQIPQYQYQAGLLERNAPLDWQSEILKNLGFAGQGGQASGNSFSPNQPNPWPAAIGEITDAGVGWYDSTQDNKEPRGYQGV